MLFEKLNEWWKKKTTVLELKKPILVLDIYGEEHNHITSIYMDSFDICHNVYNIWNKIGIVPKYGTEPSYAVEEINSGTYKKKNYVRVDYVYCGPNDLNDNGEDVYHKVSSQSVIFFLKHHFRFIPNINEHNRVS